MKGTSLDVFVDCETYDTEEFFIGLGEQTTQQNNVPYLDVSANLDGNKLIVSVVNRHLTDTINTDILLQEGSYLGTFSVYEVNGPDIKAQNDFGIEKVNTLEKSPLSTNDKTINYGFPPHSVTLLKGKVNLRDN
jgi:alpha-N-arabinofuranosidase